MIEPTVGRIVWVYRNVNQPQPFAGIVTYVENNELIQVTTFPNGINETIKLLQTDADYKGEYPYATWMPYQKGQAAKTEQLEKQSNKITYEKTASERDQQSPVTHTFKD